MANTEAELSKMVRSFRVSDLQSLLTYAGRNKNGKKYDLQNRALDLVKLRNSAIEMKVRELHHNRYTQARGHTDPHEMFNPAQNPVMDPVVPGFSGRPPLAGPAMIGHGLPVIPPHMSKNFLGHPSQMNQIPQYPINPEVTFKNLPFYDILDELIRPTSLVTMPNDRFQERNLTFYFTPRQVLELQTNLDTQIQLRMCVLDTSCDQEDEIPGSICLKINNKNYNLPNPIPTNKPGVEPKRPKRPIDITHFIKKSTTEGNEVFISWASSTSKPYVLAVYLVRKQSSSVLIRRLKANGVRNPDHTTAMIKEKLSQDRDSEIATMSLRGSLMCPLGKIKMKLPCRAITCTHLQCFDASLYLQMNEKKPKWICPVCDKPAYFKSLAIDGLFLDITCKAPSECTEVQFHEDGSWTPVMPVKKLTEISEALFEPPPKDIPKAPTVSTKQPKKSIEVISLDSDSDTEDSWLSVLPDNNYKSTENTFVPSPQNNSLASDIYSAGPSKIEIPSFVPEKSTLPPLPESLDIDSSDTDCIIGVPPILSGPGSSGFNSMTGMYENVSPAPSPKRAKVEATPLAAQPENVNVNRSNRPYRDFDLFSLIQEKQEETFNNYPSRNDDTGSPDIIDLD